MLEDVRLDEGSLYPASNWDNNGRGIHKIYIKRASKFMVYFKAGLFGSKGDVTADGVQILGTDEKDDEINAHQELEDSIKECIGKLPGLQYDAAQQAHIVEEQLVEEQLVEEQESVVELIWI